MRIIAFRQILEHLGDATRPPRIAPARGPPLWEAAVAAPVGAAVVTFKNLVGATGTPIDEDWKRKRREALLAAYREVDPQVLLIELFPFGRRQMRFELLPLLDTAIGRSSTHIWRRPLIVSYFSRIRDVGTCNSISLRCAAVAPVRRSGRSVRAGSAPSRWARPGVAWGSLRSG